MIRLIEVIDHSHCQCCGTKDLCVRFDVFDRYVYFCEECIKKSWNMMLMERLRSIKNGNTDKAEGCFQ